MKAMANQYMKKEESELFKAGDVDVNTDWNDVLFFIGLGLFTTGLWIYSPAVSLTATGAILMRTAYMRAGGDKD